MNIFSEDEKQRLLAQLNKSQKDKWEITADKLKKDFKFKNFTTAFEFMSLVAAEADKLDHHPDWCNSYNRVSIALTTHSVGGLTELDFSLAQAIEVISWSLPPGQQ